MSANLIFDLEQMEQNIGNEIKWGTNAYLTFPNNIDTGQEKKHDISENRMKLIMIRGYMQILVAMIPMQAY